MTPLKQMTDGELNEALESDPLNIKIADEIRLRLAAQAEREKVNEPLIPQDHKWIVENFGLLKVIWHLQEFGSKFTKG